AYAWIEAEAQGFPLASAAAFERRIVALSRSAPGVLDDSGLTAKLADALELHLRPRAGGMSIEVLRQLRDGAWFGAAARVPLLDHLTRLARHYLEPRGSRVALRDDTGRLELARAEAIGLARRLYRGEQFDLDDLVDARRLRHDARALAWLG